MGDVKEGYLCPICVEDLGNFEELTAHFEANHAAGERDVLHSLKGFIGRARRKILADSPVLDEEQTPDWGQQEIGVVQSHTGTVRMIRGRRVDRYVGQSNKLLIRLTKLVVDAPSDPEMRKAREKSLVPWVEDADVKLCPSCAKAFSISRRRHHCRLCGGIMCQLCSEFLDSATVPGGLCWEPIGQRWGGTTAPVPGLPCSLEPPPFAS